MKLTDLDPHWVKGVDRVTGAERTGIAISFLCPTGCGDRCVTYFVNPLDGGPTFPVDQSGNQKHRWQRDGDSFETMTLSPSVNWLEHTDGPSHWHGFITNGRVTP